MTVPVLGGFLALAVDLGRVQTAKAELAAALDAAARYAVTGLDDNTAVAKAIAAANDNRIDGTNFSLTAADVSVGTYDSTTRTFTANATPADAVRINVSRTSGRTIQTTLLRMLGVNAIPISQQVVAYDSAASTAVAPTGAIKGLISLGSSNLNGAMSIRAWDSSTNTTLNTASAWVAVQTAGAASLNSGLTVQGEYQVAGAVSANGVTVTKGYTTAPSNLSSLYPAPTVPTGATSLGNYTGPSGATQTFGPGTYYFTSFSVPSGKTVIFSGAAKVYISGACSIDGNITTYQNLPSNLKLYSTGGGVNMNTSSTTPLYAEIYGPTSALNMASRPFYGSIVASTTSINSSQPIYLDARSTVGGFTATGGGTPHVVSVVPQILK